MKAALLSVILVVAAASPLLHAQGVLLDSKVSFMHTDLDEALSDAKEHYDGDLFLYLFTEDSDNHDAVVSNGLNNDTLAQYVNGHFARIAIDVSTPEGAEILKSMRPDMPDWDFIALWPSGKPGAEMHGWGNVGDGSSAASWLRGLEDYKNRVPVKMPDVIADDTASTYTLLAVAAAEADSVLSFSGTIFSPTGDFSMRFYSKATPFEQRLVTDDFVALFRNDSPGSEMVVSFKSVENDSTTGWGEGRWDYTMVSKRGPILMTTGL